MPLLAVLGFWLQLCHGMQAENKSMEECSLLLKELSFSLQRKDNASAQFYKSFYRLIDSARDNDALAGWCYLGMSACDFWQNEPQIALRHCYRALEADTFCYPALFQEYFILRSIPETDSNRLACHVDRYLKNEPHPQARAVMAADYRASLLDFSGALEILSAAGTDSSFRGVWTLIISNMIRDTICFSKLDYRQAMAASLVRVPADWANDNPLFRSVIKTEKKTGFLTTSDLIIRIKNQTNETVPYVNEELQGSELYLFICPADERKKFHNRFWFLGEPDYLLKGADLVCFAAQKMP